jgi:ankyrin repeat protein
MAAAAAAAAKTVVEKDIPAPESDGIATAAARNGQLARLRELIDASPDAMASKDELGMSPLSWASRNGHLDIVNYLIGISADLDAVR